MTRRIFIAARIHSFNPRGSGTAMLVSAGRIEALATAAEVRRLAPTAEVVDFGAATITPGLVDSHIHMTEWAVARAQVDVTSATSPEDAANQAARGARSNGWVVGRGWSAGRMGGDYPNRAALDARLPDEPVALQSHDMHAMWLNSRALQVAGIGRSTPDPAGGRIVRSQDGEPTGVLLENAAQMIVPHLPRYDCDSISPLVIDAQKELHGYGITGVHSFPGVHLPEPDPFPVFQQLHQHGLLKLRVLQHISLEQLDDAIRVGLRSGFGNDWLRVGGVKMFLDGALGSRTALMREPYEGTTDRGVQVMREQDFRDAVTRAAQHGIATVVHAIGDAAVTLAFEVLTQSQSQPLSLPHRVEHVQCLPADCAPLLGKGIVCSVQPSHLMTDWRAADRHWGARAATTYAFRFMLDNGAIVAFGSDAPVERADPRHGLYAAVTRMDLGREPAAGWHPAQRVAVHEAFAGYTTAPAYTAGIELAHAGLAPGALADFVAWKQDPMSVDPHDLLRLEPQATVVGGEIVYGG